MPNQSQKHGFTWENDARENVFHLPIQKNDRNIHDIPRVKNRFDPNENCSLKATGSYTIYCGDILRFYSYDFNEKNTIIVIKYIQKGDKKIIDRIYEIDYNKECHQTLFGNLPKEEIERYVNGVKSIPFDVKGSDALKIFDYKKEKKQLQEKYNNIIQINPKVDSSQSRVQCSIPKFVETLKKFIIYQSEKNYPNQMRGGSITKEIKSTSRKRNGVTIKQLKTMCKENGIKKYSQLNRSQLLELLKEKGILQ